MNEVVVFTSGVSVPKRAGHHRMREAFQFVLACSILALIGCGASRPTTETSAPAQAAPPPFASTRISVVTRGTGPDVILIPGMSSHRAVWDDTVAALEGRYRFHLVQVNGFAGFAAGANADGPVAAPVAEEIARYIEESHLDHPAVIGHSMGGSIGLMIAARHPNAISRLMVVDMIPFMGAMFGPPGTTSESIRPVADQMRASMQGGQQGQLPPQLEQMIASMTRTESARQMLLKHARDSDLHVVSNAFYELIVTDLRPELSRITVPVTVLYVYPPGAPVSAEQMDAFCASSYASLLNVQLEKIADSNHFIMLDQPKRFQAEVEELMAR